MAEVKNIIGQGIGDDFQQIGPVDGQKLRSVSRFSRAVVAFLAHNDTATLVVACQSSSCWVTNVDNWLFDVQKAERLQRIGAHKDPGADFFDFWGLFVDRDLNAAPNKRQRRGETADAAADNGNLSRSGHAAPLSTYIQKVLSIRRQ